MEKKTQFFMYIVSHVQNSNVEVYVYSVGGGSRSFIVKIMGSSRKYKEGSFMEGVSIGDRTVVPNHNGEVYLP